MVQYIPGPESILGPALGQVAESVGHLINPNREFQLRMQQAIALNPNLLQTLADTEKQSPGVLGALGFGHLTDVITKVPESAGAQVARENRGTIVDTATTKLQGEQGQTKLDSGRIAATIDFLKDPKNKNIQGDQILKMLTGETADQRRTSAAQARGAEAGATVAEARVPGEVKQAELTTEAFDQAKANMPLLAGRDFRRLAQDFVHGKMDAATAQSIFLTPGSATALETAIRAQEAEESRALQRQLLSLRGGDKESNFRTQKAYQMFASTNAGTVDSWEEILFKGGGAKAIELIKKDPTKRTQAENDLIASYEANERELLNNRITQARNYQTGIGQTLGQLRTSIKNDESDAAINLNVSNLQSILDAMSDETGRTYQVHYDRPPAVGSKKLGAVGKFFTGKDLYFTDETGARVDDSVVLAAQLPRTVKGIQNADVIRTVGEMSKFTGAQNKSALDRIKKERPEIYQAIVDLLPAKSKP